MTTQTEALKLARDEIAGLNGDLYYSGRFDEVLQEIDKALAQPEQKPVGEVSKAAFGDYPVICWRTDYVAKIGDKFYTTQPQRTWVGLTDEERGKVYSDWRWSEGRTSNLALCKDIEALLKEKNT